MNKNIIQYSIEKNINCFFPTLYNEIKKDKCFDIDIFKNFNDLKLPCLKSIQNITNHNYHSFIVDGAFYQNNFRVITSILKFIDTFCCEYI